jgi:NO-binding membrane sensor protein with MHYT domain
LAAADALLKVMPTLKQQDSTVLTIAICLIHFTSREAGTFEER